MDEKKYKLNIHTAALSLPAEHAEKLLSLGDGEAALLYLYILRAGGSLDEEKAAADLGRTRTAVQVAARALDRAGLFAAGEAPLPPPEELPEYTAEDIVARSEGDPAFKALIAECRRVMGRGLSTADLKTLFGIYDRLGLEGEVIMLLINHCAARLKKRYGEGRLPTMHMVEKEAFRWANREIFTVRQAESYIAETDRREQDEARFLKMIGITDRAPSRTEQRYLDSWLTMGFSGDALELAFDRTVVGTNRMNWAYMDKILRTWQEKGLFTPEDIEKGDVKPGRRVRPQKEREPAPDRGDDLDRLERILSGKE